MATKTQEHPTATKYQATLISEKLEIELRMDEMAARLQEVDEKLVKSIGVGNTVITDEAQVTPTVQVHQVVDFDQLVETAPYWSRKVTKKVFDRAKFTLLRKAGVVPQNVLDIVEEKETKPFLRVTIKQAKD